VQNEILGQAISIVATLLTFASYQMNKQSQVLITQTAATGCMCIGYFFLGATTGFALNIVCIIRNLSFYGLKNKTKQYSLYAGLFFAVAVSALGAFSWQGYSSLLMIIGLAVNTVFLSLGDPQSLRKSILFTSSIILVYNCVVFSIGGIANELVAIGSSVIGIFRFRKSAKKDPEPSKSELS